MPVLDGCINSIFEPGNIGSSSGTPPTVITPGYTPAAPSFITSDTGSVSENATLAFTITTDEQCTIAITGGADAAQFELVTATLDFSHVLRWVGDGTQDFEAPADVGLNNTYVVEVTVTDGAAVTAMQTITITVTDIPGGTPIGLLLTITREI